MNNTQIFKVRTVAPEARIWANLILSSGAILSPRSFNIGNRLVQRLKLKSYYPKIVYLLPMLGSGINAALCPLVDQQSVGISSQSNFVNADFSETTGIQGDGASKIITLPIKTSSLGTGSNGGHGFWETNSQSLGTSRPFGAYDNGGSSIWGLELFPGSSTFYWHNGNVATFPSGGNGWFVGNRSSSTDRRIYKNGVLLNTNTSADSTAGISDRNINLMGVSYGGGAFYYPNRCGLALLTDGTLSDADQTDLYNTLLLFAINPSSKPAS